MQVEDGRVDAMDCVGPYYHIFAVFNGLVHRSIVVIYPFAWTRLEWMGLLATSQNLILYS
jgi:hypothetical protein